MSKFLESDFRRPGERRQKRQEASNTYLSHLECDFSCTDLGLSRLHR
jgi:hypothetical protein